MSGSTAILDNEVQLRANGGDINVKFSSTGLGALSVLDKDNNTVTVTGLRIQHAQVTVNTSTYTIDPKDIVIFVDYSSTGVSTLTLPTMATAGSHHYTIKDSGGNCATFNIIVQTPGDESTIDGSTTLALNVNYMSVNFVLRSSNNTWHAI